MYYNRYYSNLDEASISGDFTVNKIASKGRIDFHFSEEMAVSTSNSDTIMPESITSHIYLDTIHNNLKVSVASYTSGRNEQTDYITFNSTGNIIETNQFIPRETGEGYYIDNITLDSKGKIIRILRDVKDNLRTEQFKNCILLHPALPNFPKWREETSPVYIRHFSKDEFNGSALNPFKFGGINGSSTASVWYGNAYCDIRIGNRMVKLKIPFGYNNLLLTRSEDYYAELEYYILPKPYFPNSTTGILISNDNLYIFKINQSK